MTVKLNFKAFKNKHFERNKKKKKKSFASYKLVYIFAPRISSNVLYNSIDSVAQLVEQYTFNVWALGSNPSGITNYFIINYKVLILKVLQFCKTFFFENYFITNCKSCRT
jgi:hypothetical protein